MSLARRWPAVLAAVGLANAGLAVTGLAVTGLMATGPAEAGAGAAAPSPAAQAPAGAARPGACALLVTEHRSARPLLQVPLAEARLRISFVHSVLGTPVEDHYEHRAGAWHLVEERFEGQGYGLPHAAAEGERLLTEGGASRLLLDRRIDPLVVRPLPAQRMRLHLDDGRQWLLGDLADVALQIRATGC